MPKFYAGGRHEACAGRVSADFSGHPACHFQADGKCPIQAYCGRSPLITVPLSLAALFVTGALCLHENHSLLSLASFAKKRNIQSSGNMMGSEESYCMQADVVKGGPKFLKIFEKLDEKSKQHQEIDGCLVQIKNDITVGDRIPNDRWPRCYIQAHDVNNLRRYSLPGGWRIIYTIYAKNRNVTCNILEIFDHKNYEKRFGY